MQRLGAWQQQGVDAHFNVPVKFRRGDWYVNERIVEVAFVHAHVPFDGAGKRILEFGCTRSWLALSLSSLGYEVVAVDLRSYPFDHPNLTFVRGDLLALEDYGQGYDFITAVSTLEHVGLGAYGEPADDRKLTSILRKLSSLLKSNGKIIASVPFGEPSYDEFERSFSQQQLMSLIAEGGLQILVQLWHRRERFRYWTPCSLAEAVLVSNSREARGRTGVNCVACLVLGRS